MEYNKIDLRFQSESDVLQEIAESKNKPWSSRFEKLPVPMQKVWIRCRQYRIKYKNMPKPETGMFALDSEILLAYVEHSNLIGDAPFTPEQQQLVDQSVKIGDKPWKTKEFYNITMQGDQITVSKYSTYTYTEPDPVSRYNIRRLHRLDGSITMSHQEWVNTVIPFWSDKLGVKLVASNIKQTLSAHGYYKFATVHIKWDA